ncbi:MAG: putative rane protein [Microbacteriaceae bacterium]|nr:putative rane protein [Microbacteriaceae bacterium]HEV7957357.1 hypothetical protein [Marisediminicola sp.]
MKGLIGAGVMALLLLLYLFLVTQLAFRLFSVDNAVAAGIGIALLVLPLLGGWALVAEVLFGIRSQRLGGILAGEGDLPGVTLPRRPSGRPVRSAADAEFPIHQAAVESDPDSWRNWFKLGLAYDACGDRRRARQSIRRAIALNRGSAAAD